MNFIRRIILDRSTGFEEWKVISDADKLLKVIFQQSSAGRRLKAVTDLEKLCEKPENMAVLCLNEDLSLLSSFKQLLEMIKDDDECLYWIVRCINKLSVHDVSCVAAITSKELSLLPVLMRRLLSSSNEEMIERIETTISNCSLFEDCHDYLLSSEIGWLDYLQKRLKEKPNDMQSYWRFSAFVMNMRNENIPFMIDRKIPEIIIQKLLSYGSDEKMWSLHDWRVMKTIIEFVVYFSKSVNGSSYLIDFFKLHSDYKSFFFDLPHSSFMFSVSAMVILASIYGREENSEGTEALLSSHPDILPQLINIMETIMNRDVNRTEIHELMKKDLLSVFDLSVVTVALRNLSISDYNKSVMIKHPKLIFLACEGIRLLIDNAAEREAMIPDETWFRKAGGGGGDGSDGVRSVSWNHDCSKIVSGSVDKTIKIWDAVSGELLSTLEGHSNGVASVSWNHDSSKIVSGSDDGTIKIWDAVSGELLSTLEGHSNDVRSVSWNHDSSKLVSGSWDNTIKIWDAVSGDLLSTLEGHSNGVVSVSWSHDSSKIVSGSYDGTIRIWDAVSGELLSTLEGHSIGVASVSWNHDSSKIVSGSWDSTIKIWDAVSGELLSTLEGHSDGIASLSWDHDGSKVVSGSWDNTIKIWDAVSGELLSTLEGHSNGVASVSWNHDSSKIVSGSYDGTIKIWDAVSGELLSSLEGGRGRDLLTAENLLELLLQLSSLFEDAIAVKSAFMVPFHDLKKMLEELLNIPIARQLPLKTRRSAWELLSKLYPSKVHGPGNSMSIGSQHVMLSYS
jgi:WD40 repeat protein